MTWFFLILVILVVNGALKNARTKSNDTAKDAAKAKRKAKAMENLRF